ncbi:hypothetical protein FH972_021324 [Carpinus fangiana]|uniref:Tyrosine specific protein phosphatases domain-containing protein n=1 Tax=Carpinus fangiana TaxID=176857 RepID=A0A5N6KPM2_9ROSI|nr:hypothetical protein FH972_021324 [Carpinus fangiana]
MGACGSTMNEDGEAKKRSAAIDRALEDDERKLRRECKILLLGSGESGKSTVVKQMKIIHQGGYQPDELALYRVTIYKNLLDCSKAVIAAMGQFELVPENPENTEICQYLNSYELDPDPSTILEPKVGDAVTSLWKDPCISKVMERQSEFYLMDSASYFFDEAQRIASKEYSPTESDVLRARTKTTGIYETRFTMGSLSIHMFDVGGQRSERKKWIHCFENVTSIIFCVALSEYDQVLLEEASQNRMMESLVLFDSVVNSRWFMRTSIILFLNKVDLFKKKLERSPLEDYFPDYSGGDDVNRAAKYLLWRFNQVNRAHLHLYPQHEPRSLHRCCATTGPDHCLARSYGAGSNRATDLQFGARRCEAWVITDELVHEKPQWRGIKAVRGLSTMKDAAEDGPQKHVRRSRGKMARWQMIFQDKIINFPVISKNIWALLLNLLPSNEEEVACGSVLSRFSLDSDQPVVAGQSFMDPIQDQLRTNADYSRRLPSPPRYNIPPLFSDGDWDCKLESAIKTSLPPGFERIPPPSGQWEYNFRQQAQLVAPLIYLGPSIVARNPDQLRSMDIACVLMIRRGTKEFAAKFTPAAVRISREAGLQAELIDVEDYQQLASTFSTTSAYLSSNARQDPARAVLVCCDSGNDISAAVVAAYIMTEYKVTMVLAIQLIQLRRFCTSISDDLYSLLDSYQTILEARADIDPQPNLLLSASSGDQSRPEKASKRTLSVDEDRDLNDDDERFVGRPFTPFVDE